MPRSLAALRRSRRGGVCRQQILALQLPPQVTGNLHLQKADVILHFLNRRRSRDDRGHRRVAKQKLQGGGPQVDPVTATHCIDSAGLFHEIARRDSIIVADRTAEISSKNAAVVGTPDGQLGAPLKAQGKKLRKGALLK